MPESPKRQLIIMRGLPGSGKTTRAKQLLIPFGGIASADDFFMRITPNCVEYRFDKDLLEDAHEWCRSVAARWADLGRPQIIIDNCNAKAIHMEPYRKIALRYNYKVRYEMPYSDSWIRARKYLGKNADPAAQKAWAEHFAEKTTHEVPAHTIYLMMLNWDENPNLPK